jgi:predicted dehydrogenase
MKIGIIGFGKMGMFHGALINSLPGVEIVSITDTSKWVLKAFKSVLPNIRYFLSFEKMLESCELDAVIIATPSFSHVPIAKSVLARRLPFFIEKPLAGSLQGGLELQKLAESSRVQGMVGFCSRYYDSFRKAKSVLDSGVLGQMKSVLAENYLSDVLKKETGWRFDKTLSGGGVVIDYSIHMLDLLCWFFGDVASIEAKTRKIYSENVEDDVEAFISFKCDVSAVLKSSWSNPNYRKAYMRLEIVGENATMIVTDQTLSVRHIDGTREDLSYPDMYKGYYMDIGGSNFSLQMKDFHGFVRGECTISNTIQSAVAVQRIVEGIYQSAEREAVVDIRKSE